MTDYERGSKKIVQKIMEQASDNIVSELIENCFEDFLWNCNRRDKELTVNDNKSFHRLITGFMKNIYQADEVDEEVLLARALFIIENFCQGSSKKGYEGVYYDILNNNSSINEFFMVFIDGLKNYEQYKFIEVICVRYIDPCDHALKYAVVKEIVRKYGYLIPDDVCEHPTNFISHIPKLIASITSSNDIFSGIMNR